MSKILKPARLFQAFLFLLIVASACFLTSCNPGGKSGDEPPINTDTLKQHVIPIGEAIKLTANFRAALDMIALKYPQFKDSMDFGHAEAFPADVFRELLRQRNDSQGPAFGIRIYYGRDAAGKIRQILVPYDSNGNNIINHLVDINNQPTKGAHVEALKVSDGQAIQNGARCPTACGDDSSGLN
jgi:hypothetical protein